MGARVAVSPWVEAAPTRAAAIFSWRARRRPAGQPQLDAKKTTYKQIGKFIKVMHKQKLIKVHSKVQSKVQSKFIKVMHKQRLIKAHSKVQSKVLTPPSDFNTHPPGA